MAVSACDTVGAFSLVEVPVAGSVNLASFFVSLDVVGEHALVTVLAYAFIDEIDAYPDIVH